MDEPVQKRADRFEKQVLDFLDKKLDLRDVSGGNTFKMGGIQVDACGGHEDTLLVLECHLASKRSQKSIREKIQIFRGNIPILSRAFHKDQIYHKYKDIKFIIVLKNVTPSETDLRFAEEKPQIPIWDEQFIDYYSSLIKTIGRAAKYNLLGEIGVKPRIESRISIPAFLTKLGNYNAYTFLIEPNKLIESAYVARREVGREKYYQRILNERRIDEITKYIQSGKFFPNNIIIAFNKSPKFAPFNEISDQLSEVGKWLQCGVLTFPADYRTCWIIDGQHRLYAFQDVGTPTKVGVMAFEKMPPEIQATYFIDINREQKPVDMDLIWDLEGEMRHNSTEGIISNIVKRLNSQDPLKDRIYIPLLGKRKGKRQLKFSVICTSIKKRSLTEDRTEKMEKGGPRNPLSSKDAEKTSENVSKALSAFFQQIDGMFLPVEKTDLVYTNGGIGIMITIFERILSRINRVPTNDDYAKYVEALHRAISESYPEKQDRRDFVQKAYTEGGKSELVNSICMQMREYLGDEYFGGKITITDFEKRVTQFERGFARLLITTIGANSIEDLKELAPPDLCAIVGKRLEREMFQGNPTNISEQLTLGESLKILNYKDNWKTFRPFFIESEFGFGSINECQSAIQAVIDLRNTIKHGKRQAGKYRQQELANIYLEKLEKCVVDY